MQLNTLLLEPLSRTQVSTSEENLTKKDCLSSTSLCYPFLLFHTQKLLDSRSRPISDPKIYAFLTLNLTTPLS